MLPFFIAFYRFWRGIRAGLRDPEFQVLLSLAITELGIGTVFYHGVEKWSWLDSLYFSVTTLTTIGLGDFTPHTVMGKVFTMFYILLGVGILFSFLNVLAHHAVQESKGDVGMFSILKKKHEDKKESATIAE
ncbi:MAG TPA: potassium channel family protein [Candidatus Paceibacterota bacterium]